MCNYTLCRESQSQLNENNKAFHKMCTTRLFTRGCPVGGGDLAAVEGGDDVKGACCPGMLMLSGGGANTPDKGSVHNRK